MQREQRDDQLSTLNTSVQVTFSTEYLDHFGEAMLKCIKSSIESSLNRNPFDYPAEIIKESHSHLCNCRRFQSLIGVSQSIDSDCAPILQVNKLIMSASSSPRHTPIVVVGDNG